MKTLFIILILALTPPLFAQTISCPPDATKNVTLAAKEIRRYVYLRTGKLLTVSGKPQRRDGDISLSVDPSLGHRRIG